MVRLPRDFMGCEKKLLLLAACKATSKHYAFAVEQLRNLPPARSKEAYTDMQQLTDDAREQCGLARDELEEHLIKHRC